VLLGSRPGNTSGNVESNVTDVRVHWILELLQRSDPAQNIRIEDLATAVHLSTSRLCHVFRMQMGVSLGKYLKQIRLQRARELLQDSFLEVKEIAAALNFRDISHFVRDYKHHYGERPSQTRKRLKSA
jgi:two-component system response regulator YesN